MKHLVAILAHKNPVHLTVLVKKLLEMNMGVIVHLDSKTRSDLVPELNEIQGHIIDTSIDVKRGHISIVKATLELMKEASRKEFDYFHLISGEDLISKSETEFATFFEIHKGKEFINFNPLPIEQQSLQADLPYEIQKDQLPVLNYQFPFFKNGIGLVDTYHFQESSLMGKVISKLTRFGIFRNLYLTVFNRKVPDYSYYAGSAWMSITKRTVDYFITISNESPRLLEFMNHSLFPDEIYFQTMAMQSPFRQDIINSDLRYIDWNNDDSFGPALLQKKDVASVKKSSGFFSRKWDLSDKSNQDIIDTLTR